MKGIYLPEWQIKAAIDGRLKQFTKPLKSQPIDIMPMNIPGKWVALMSRNPNSGCVFTSQYKVGSQYYVKETWGIDPNDYGFDEDERGECVAYKENWSAENYYNWSEKYHWGWYSPIYMPAWAARVFITPTEIIVRRLQEMNRTDAILEGIADEFPLNNRGLGSIELDSYADLWDKQYPKTPLSSNPWAATYKISVEVKK